MEAVEAVDVVPAGEALLRLEAAAGRLAAAALAETGAPVGVERTGPFLGTPLVLLVGLGAVLAAVRVAAGVEVALDAASRRGVPEAAGLVAVAGDIVQSSCVSGVLEGAGRCKVPDQEKGGGEWAGALY